MFEIFTERARKVILRPRTRPIGRADRCIGCEHLLVGLLREGTGIAGAALAERSVTVGAVRVGIDELHGRRPVEVAPNEALATIGIDLGEVRARLEATFGPGARADPPPPYDPGAKEALQLAVAESGRLRQRLVDAEHELMGVAQVTDGCAAKVLERLGVDPAALVEQLRARAAPEELRVRALLVERPGLDRMVDELAEDRRDDALGVLQDLGASIQVALRQEHEDGIAATRRLVADLEAQLAHARGQLDALRST